MRMESCLEGNWNNFTFKFITEDDIPNIMDHLRDVYCRHEPMMVYCGYTTELGDDFCTMAQYALTQDPSLSFFAVDNKTQKVAAIQIADSVEIGDPGGFPIQFQSQKIQRLETQLVSLVQGANIFERFGVEKFAEILYTSVDPTYWGQGLGTEIFRRSIAHFQRKGFSVCMSEFTSPATRNIGNKFGFVELDRMHFTEFRDLDGNQILPNANGEEFIVVAALSIPA